MADSDPRAAFIIAALVLLVMPIVYMLGLAAALVMQFTPLRDASDSCSHSPFCGGSSC
jgi:hypothetical protein